MDATEIRRKKYYRWEIFFTLLGVLGLLEVLTGGYVLSHFNFPDMGIVSFLLIVVLKPLFGADFTATISVLTSIVLGLSVLWFIPAYRMHKKIKNLSIESTNEPSNRTNLS